MLPVTPKPALTGFTRAQLEDRFEAEGVDRWRASPILRWIYRGRAVSFDAMTDLPQAMRAELDGRYRLTATTIARRHGSDDGTQKLLLRLDDGQHVETVLIRDGERTTVCVSTQVGCPMACVFCASGLNGLVRNLVASEIVEQALHVQRLLPEGRRLDNVVIMGIGEPLLNLEAVTQALRTWKAAWGMGIGFNRVTLSTVGLVDKIPRLAASSVTPNLAISLHASNDRLRAEVVPTMKKRRVAELVKAGVEYRAATGKDVTFEYVLLDGVNDDRKHALELGKKLRGTRCKVNVIPFNPVPELPYRTPSEARIDRFVEALGACGVPVTVRRRKGDAISAACGQLRHVAETDLAPLASEGA